MSDIMEPERGLEPLTCALRSRTRKSATIRIYWTVAA
jgi:hypothetical protein